MLKETLDAANELQRNMQAYKEHYAKVQSVIDHAKKDNQKLELVLRPQGYNSNYQVTLADEGLVIPPDMVAAGYLLLIEKKMMDCAKEFDQLQDNSNIKE